MKNCRNCAFAKWDVSEKGRKLYGHWAECVAPVKVVLPNIATLKFRARYGLVTKSLLLFPPSITMGFEMSRKRLQDAERKGEILAAAIRVAEKPGGLAGLTRSAVAAEANCSDALISVHFGTMVAFKRDVVRAAIHAANLQVIGQAIVAGMSAATKLDADVKHAALESLAQ